MFVKKNTLLITFNLLILSSFTAQAQTQVQLYGNIDTGLAHSRISTEGTTNGLINGGQDNSYWGLIGTEELGNGLSVIFQLESGFDTLTGNSEEDDSFFNYAAKLGLEHNALGGLYVGRQNPISQAFNAELELAGWKDFGMGALLRNSDDYQQNNAIQYSSPEWAGFQLGTGYKSKNKATTQSSHNEPDDSATNIALRYEANKLYAALSYDKRKQAKAWQFGLKYDFDAFTFSTAWARQKNGFVGNNGFNAIEFIEGGRIDSWYVGASISVTTNGELGAQWSLAKPNWHWQDTDQKAKKAQVYSMGYLHTLSARTQLYAFGAYGKNYSPDEMLSADNPKSRRVAIGITHSF